MKKFLRTYLTNDGAGIFAMLWIAAIIVCIATIVLTGGNRFPRF